MSIKITIQKTVRQVYTVKENVLTKRTPTEIVEEELNPYRGGSKKEVKFIEEYAVSEVMKQNTETVTLLEQTIEVDSDFDLPAVITAINRLDKSIQDPS